MFGQSQPYKAGRDNRIVPSQRNSELWTPTSRWYIPGHYPPPTGNSIFTSPTGWGTKKCHFWNSQLPLIMTILSVLPTPVLPSAKFPCTILYNWLVFFHHITWTSNGTNSVTLKMEAVWSSKTAEHLSPNSAETRRQLSSAQLPWKTCTSMSNYMYQTQTAFQQVLCFMLLFYDTNYWVQCHYACCQPTCLGDITLHQYGSHHITYSI